MLPKRFLIPVIALFMVFLVVTLPVCFAVQYDLTYDANGNLVTGDGKYRVYNSFNQLWKVYNGSNGSGVLLQEYAYHPLEERVWMKKTYNSSGNLTETVYYWTKNFVTVVNLSGTYNFTYVYHNGELIAQSVNGVKTFFHNDIKGSVVAVSNASGAVIENISYSPLGEVITGGNTTRYEYEGKETEPIIGDTDFNARRYKPDLGIFEQPDTLISNVYDPQSLNRYMFERGNPYKNKDVTGHQANANLILNFAQQLLEIYPYAWPLVVVMAVVGVVYYAVTSTPQQEININSMDYQYVTRMDMAPVFDYGYAGPPEALDKMLEDLYKQLEELQQVKDIGDLTHGDLRINGENDDSAPYDILLYPLPGIVPSKELIEQLASYYVEHWNDRYSSRGGSPVISLEGKKINLGSGGRYEKFRCNADSCSVYQGTKAERDAALSENGG